MEMSFLIPLFSLFLVILNFASCEMPSTWNELLGSKFPIFPETTGSSDILMSLNVNIKDNEAEVHSRVLEDLSSMLSDPQISHQIYSTYLVKYEKPASRNEMNQFKKNVMDIANQNLMYYVGKDSWKAGINEFTDMDSEEFGKTVGLPAQTMH